MEVITSINNDKVKNWQKLKLKKYREETKTFLVEGDHLVIEALKTNNVKEIVVDENKLFPVNVPTHYVTSEVLHKISDQPSTPDIIGIVNYPEELPLGERILLIDNLQDPGNLGTIIRSAVAFNIETIVLGDNCVDLFNEKVIRASEGMLFHVNIVKKSLDTLIPELKNQDYQILGTRVTHGTKLSDVRLRTKFAFIIGNEGNGVREEILDMCDNYIYIPMNEACESLNAGVAAGIILYEFSNRYFN